ncbi:hypothetical protein [Pseudoalteromonas byunsanensis]|uniref:DUF4426 domain-containing protein n=1 Tax=Pseudoalteromonas byunsanensis TaxID=327939 RepID=A0A1S1N432_9GAMM|nr:hypothetical protein [Pseudoalteromonas byunsanensis]OHU93391.1 hypothetical protein BIW53_18690 [Pseudoalteromonas byunsanensis]
MKSYLLSFLLMFSSVSIAQQSIYTFDGNITNIPPSAFVNDSRQYPKISDFSLQAYFPMSSEQGDRAALVTIKNMASGKRFLQAEHVMAVLADGTRHTPITTVNKLALEGQQTVTLTVEFGRHDYPIVSVYTSEKLK